MVSTSNYLQKQFNRIEKDMMSLVIKSINPETDRKISPKLSTYIKVKSELSEELDDLYHRNMDIPGIESMYLKIKKNIKNEQKNEDNFIVSSSEEDSEEEESSEEESSEEDSEEEESSESLEEEEEEEEESSESDMEIDLPRVPSVRRKFIEKSSGLLIKVVKDGQVNNLLSNLTIKQKEILGNTISQIIKNDPALLSKVLVNLEKNSRIEGGEDSLFESMGTYDIKEFFDGLVKFREDFLDL